ncbi:Negative regulator of sigma E activity [Succinivibrio dextrinosolvens DSM 3072]|uniref:Negative regulator of sigma E activity n=1 Tax=Succinivibrio dextrinosolvens DSM 3072 TaxID=1123324 RepID=A0A1T4VFR0_9GAMM|nr:RseA family anti-sigma factor [Succinivibrio dextrinosolvens]SKA63789.1 Negative regulator of sigma E activity [Succinivibrio dextrinosolvens DSM 3072]
MMNFQNVDKEELKSALYDGENLPEGRLKLSENDVEHIQNWSLIGATLRNEMSGSQLKPDFAASLMNRIQEENITPELVDQTEIQSVSVHSLKNVFKKVSFGIAQMAIAASVAAVTIIGYQTYNAEGTVSNEVSAASTIGAIGTANLASYQTNRKSSNEIKLNEDKSDKDSVSANNIELKKQQKLEVERINNYIRGYVLDTASNN